MAKKEGEKKPAGCLKSCFQAVGVVFGGLVFFAFLGTYFGGEPTNKPTEQAHAEAQGDLANNNEEADDDFLAAADKVKYDVIKAERLGNIKLSLDIVIPAPVDREVLAELGRRLYDIYGGEGFQSVFMVWYLPNYQIGAGGWGITHYQNGQWRVDIMAMQG